MQHRPIRTAVNNANAMYTRLATSDDVNAIARVASRASGPLANGLWAKACFPEMTHEQHELFMRDRTQAWFNEGFTVHVAIAEPGKDGTGHLQGLPAHSYAAYMAKKAAVVLAEIEAKDEPDSKPPVIGVIAYIKRSKDDPSPCRLPPMRAELLAAADMAALAEWNRQATEWKEDVLLEYGSHYHGGHLSVAKAYEKHGIASHLCRLLLADMEREDTEMPLFMDTDYYTMPFYDRFCQHHGLRTTIYGRPYKMNTKRLELFMYHIKIDKKPFPTMPDEIEVLRNMPGNTIQR